MLFNKISKCIDVLFMTSSHLCELSLSDTGLSGLKYVLEWFRYRYGYKEYVLIIIISIKLRTCRLQ